MGQRPNTFGDVLLRLVICEPTTLPTGCWEWPDGKNNGYGFVSIGGRNLRVHCLTYEHFVGPVPEGMVLDHLCRNRACANFEHLEPVTHRQNILRGAGATAVAARKTHCPTGHAYDEGNTYVCRKGYRHCRACRLARGASDKRRERERKRVA